MHNVNLLKMLNSDQSIINLDSDTENEETNELFFEDKHPGNIYKKVPMYNIRKSDKRKAIATDDNIESKIAKTDDSIIILDESTSTIYISDDGEDSNTAEPTINVKQIKLPKVQMSAPKKPTKRIVIIDGSNVALSPNSKTISVERIQTCMKYFEDLGHEVKTVIPQFRMKFSKSTNSAELHKLNELGKLVLTPCKNLTNQRSVTSYDDRFILRIAAEYDAVIISNDNFKDLENENAEFKKVIETSVIGFTWFKDSILFPEDPYGKQGPKLNQILIRFK